MSIVRFCSLLILFGLFAGPEAKERRAGYLNFLSRGNFSKTKEKGSLYIINYIGRLFIRGARLLFLCGKIPKCLAFLENNRNGFGIFWTFISPFVWNALDNRPVRVRVFNQKIPADFSTHKSLRWDSPYNH